MQIYTRASFPQNNLETLFNLALAYQDTRQLTSACDTFANIIDTLESFQARTFYRLEIKGEKQEFSEQLNKVDRRMVEVCLQLGYTDKGIEYVERSKARSLVELLANYNLHPKGNIPDSILATLKGTHTQYSKLDEAIRTGQFLCNTCLCYWQDNKGVTRNDLQKLRSLLAKNKEFPRYVDLKSAR